MRLAERPAGTDPSRPGSGRGRVRVVTEPAPDLDPIALYAAARRAGLVASLWLQPDRGIAIVGVGTAWSVGLAGPERFRRADAAWRALVADLRRDDPDADPVLLGGLGFSGLDPAAGERWASFGASGLVLHELTWRRTPDRTTVTWATGDGPRAPRLVKLLEGAAAATEPSDANRPVGPRLRIAGERPDRATWDRLVGMFAGAVGRGRLDKVVLARRVDLVTSDELPLDVEAALRHLAATAPESTIYAFDRAGEDAAGSPTGGPTFLGATPERLVRTVGRDFETVAIAGSAARDPDPATDARLGTALLASEKDREEHAVVVEMLRGSLAPLASELRIAPAPRLLELRHVRHLMTPVAGTLRDDAGLLSLAAVLHPTPAVGGEPRDLALELIAEHEGFERGWYAGPVGWVGGDGDGELCVALRCGVVDGARASLFAGCGIVADSDPEREWEESRTKLRAVGNALGGIEEAAS